MKTNKLLFSLFFLLFGIVAFAQNARITGVLLDEENKPIDGASVTAGDKTVMTLENGFFVIDVPSGQVFSFSVKHPGYKQLVQKFELSPNETMEFNPVMSAKFEQLRDVVINKANRDQIEGVTNLKPELARKLPSANGGIEAVVKLLQGVTSNNELSTAYSVRGGNYDENLVYVNEIEIYRPFLIRSGQQEGLSFTNTDMVQDVNFSSGGFQAKYGDKLSSVLDITYRVPTKFAASAEASFLGGALSADLVSKDKRWSGIIGARYRDNSLLVNSQETSTNYRPRFYDIQTSINFKPSPKWTFSFLGNISENRYNYAPLTRQTNFGTIDEPIALQIFYDGQEKDKYQTYFGTIKTTYEVSENFTLKFIGSAYHAIEREYFDIFAAYFLGEVDANIGSDTFGDVTFNRGIGTQLNHGRNDLDALIVNAELKGSHKLPKETTIEWGFKYSREDIRDRLVEWEVIDSAGFSLNPPIVNLPNNDQPYNPYTGPLVPYQNVRALNYTTIDRLSGFAQFSRKINVGRADAWFNLGVRAHNWTVKNEYGADGKSQTVFSPRAQFSIKPKWGDRDLMFRISGGMYYQPPMYRELRDSSGTVNPDVKAQRSIHYVFGGDYSFKMWNRPFRFTAEAYYKSMSDINTYTLENVRIRYRANNDAKAFATGLDMRLNGEFVPGTESWFSFSYMKTEENLNDRGYIARPTDQRLKFGVLFQDYMPTIPNVKVYINLVYNTGLPGGSPSYADPYIYQSRLRDYRRADVGFSYVFTETNDKRPEGHWLKKFQDLSLGFEIFNMFNNQNAITNTWVRDVYTKNQYGIPNYMTTRVFNVKLSARLN
ncbi:carboxypeptidase regulatory-like domain-containing protein [Flavobacterium sp.]|uniref:TonB-dependent receptor n=1 Tax=Flavobacterium sp. TaxID=239 RepID=UPI00120F3C7C|nr:carboxypeptidase regulatory-like domain-containing protein [Flavobacterium sp.]RZJ73656.1 MAG: TonB-dependent receptor [Flavobacterium sp.]